MKIMLTAYKSKWIKRLPERGKCSMGKRHDSMYVTFFIDRCFCSSCARIFLIDFLFLTGTMQYGGVKRHLISISEPDQRLGALPSLHRAP